MKSLKTPVCLNVSLHVDEKFGGVAASMPPFCEAVNNTGRFSSRLAVLCEDDEVTPESLLPGIVDTFPLGRLRWAVDRKLRSHLEQLIREASIVHIHGLWREYSDVTSRLCRQMGKPYVVSAHGMLQPWALANGRWKKRAYLSAIELPVLRGAIGLRALTEAENADYQGIGLSNPIRVVPNGVDIPPATSPDLCLEAFPHLANRRLIFFLGRIHPKKGLDVLCRAWARVEQHLPDAHLVIAGPDENGTLARLRGLVRELGITNRVTFTGLLRGPMKWSALAASTLFVLPSLSEGFSVSILEALGCGLPVLISPNCNFPEITSETCGWEVDPEEIRLANHLALALTTPPGIMAEMSANARKLVRDRYTWASIGNRAADMLEECAELSAIATTPANGIPCSL